MISGWIKAHRKFLGWEWYRDSVTFHLFMHLLFMASYGPRKWRGIELNPGQLVTGRRQLSRETGISEQSIRTSLKRLESTGEITRRSTNKFSIITVCNYGLYQDASSAANQHSNQPTSTQLTHTQPAANHIQELKKVGKEEDGSTVSSGIPCPYLEIVEEYNALLGDVLPQVREVTDQRMRILCSHWVSDPDRQKLSWWRAYFEQVKRSPFLTGQKNNFRASFDWIINPGNMVKVLEGNYDEEKKAMEVLLMTTTRHPQTSGLTRVVIVGRQALEQAQPQRRRFLNLWWRIKL